MAARPDRLRSSSSGQASPLGSAAYPPVAFSGSFALTIVGLIGWAVYAWIAYFVGTRLFATAETSADWSELARTLGFANSPRILLLLGLVPGIFPIVSFVVGVWVIMTTITALKAALEMGTWRAVGTALVALIAQGIIFGIVFAIIA